nr:hypothetical protein [Vibrio vulnificus]
MQKIKLNEDEALAAMADEPSYDAPLVEEEAFATGEPAVESEVTSEESALDEELEPSEAATDNVESAEDQAQADTTDDAFDRRRSTGRNGRRAFLRCSACGRGSVCNRRASR